MFLHRKELIQPVNVGNPDARFGTFLLEQFGGATGELTALQFWVQSFQRGECGNSRHAAGHRARGVQPSREVGKLIVIHTSKIDQTAVYDAPIFKLKGGGPHFLDSQGTCWTAAYCRPSRCLCERAVRH